MIALIIIALVITIVLFIVSFKLKFVHTDYGNKGEPNRTPNLILKGVGSLFGILTLILLGFSTIYAQGVGEASVIKSFSGQVVGFNDKSGLGLKAPWDDRITYDILNQQAIFSLAANVHDDQKPFVKGGEITVTDKDGVNSNVDVSVLYSIRGDQVIPIFSHFGDQKSFESKLITQNIRDVVRTAPNSFSTLDMLTKRSDLEKQIFSELQTRWEKEGVQVESVSLQDVRYPDSVKQKYADAQNARTAQTQAQAELETAKITAQQKVVQAQADADANKILDSSLTPNILQQRALDTLKDIASKPGNLIITDGHSTPLVQVPASK